MKRILTVQDISCVGKCSLTVALPILSAMGVETAVLPTAVLSTHTGFPAPSFQDLTEGIPPILRHWQQVGVTFDGICTGYLGSVRQAELVLGLFEGFKKEDTVIIVDPVMGDDGRLYAGVDGAFVQKLTALCAKADIIMPNLTEACLLTGTPYRESFSQTDVKALLVKLSELGAGTVILTGVSLAPGQTGVMGYEKTAGSCFSYFHEKLPQSYHGTGDIFASTCAGGILQGKSCREAVQTAADFTAACIRATMGSPGDKRYGVKFEQVLPSLMKMIS